MTPYYSLNNLGPMASAFAPSIYANAPNFDYQQAASSLGQMMAFDAAGAGGGGGGGGYSQSQSSSRPTAMLDPIKPKSSSDYAPPPNYAALYKQLYNDQGPDISKAPVWTNQQVQERVNATRAQNDQATAGLMQRAASQNAAQGFGGNSPLLAALQQSAYMQNLAANTGAENALRYNAAQGNAEQMLRSQSAYEQAMAERSNQVTQRSNVELALLNALMQNDQRNFAAYANWAGTPTSSSSSMSYG